MADEPQTDLTPLIWIDVPSTFDNGNIFACASRSYVAQRYHRIKAAPGFELFNPLAVSLRFYQTEFLLPAIPYATMARRFAYIMWKINALERWLKLEVTEFTMHDRLTQEPYTIETDPNELSWVPDGEWYTPANINSLLTLITDQIRQGHGGGPSEQGARNGFEHQLLQKAREALPAIVNALWTEPPDGPGFAGAMFGARWCTLTDDGDRVVIPTFTHDTLTLVGGASYPSTPDSLIAIDATSWDYASGDPIPIDGHYMPIDKLLPGDDCHTDYFEAMRFQSGTTTNANKYPPDIQLLSEFNVMPQYLASKRHQITSVAIELPVTPANPSHFDLPPSLLIPPDGSGVAAQSYWVGERPDSKKVGGDQLLAPSHYYRWDWGQTSGFEQLPFQVNPYLNSSTGYTLDLSKTPDKQIGGFYYRGWHRLGWEIDIMGHPWRLTWWEWFTFKLGAVPSAIYLVGRLVIDNQPSHAFPDTETSYVHTQVGVGWLESDNDEIIARGCMPAPVDQFTEIAAFESNMASASSNVDEDISEILQAKSPKDGALNFGLNHSMSVDDIPQNFTGGFGFLQVSSTVRFDGGAAISPGRLEAEFGGQRVIIKQI